ncbi:MAG: zinc ABC transporter substrate-binding protein [Lachnospiraceae bacterium]|jgi:zinc transport system substrate-binding protein|nr:zinc ABC transporter substrate-binding protein [Lachnospiraceae bacterium]
MKKWMKCLIFALMATGLMTGCGTGTEPALKDDDRIKIVTTVFPEYDWVRAILGELAENTELTLLLDNKVDLHSFQPTADDIVKISTCDLFVYVGGESDEWVEAALKEASNPDMVVVNLLDILGDMVKEEEIAEGMQTEEHEHEHEEGEEEAYDEHVWLSLKNAKHICQTLAEQLEKIDPENAESYQSNASAYIDQLNSLDAKYQDAVQQSDKKVVLFGDRFPFRYLTDDYDLDYYAAFSGCSAETEASFETIVFLANKMDELSLNNILVIDGSDQKIADTILSNTQSGKKDQKILSMDSMQSTTLGDVEHGVTYLSVMEKNLEALKQALE